MKIEKAVRKAIPFIGCFYGKSGSGKTYSALKLAQGLSNNCKVCLIDTENGRASHYADEFNFDVINLDPPFGPTRYLEAIKLAENAGYSVLVIDSISHEWEGMGGCLELAEEPNANGKVPQGLNKWAKVKAEHRKLMQYLLQAKIHVIFCARAKDLLEQVGKEIVHKGVVPIQEKNFPFEMLVTFLMQDSGKLKIEKCIKGLQSELKLSPDEFISEKHGKTILSWINRGSSVDFRSKELRAEGTEIAMNGDIEGVRNWYLSLSKSDQTLVKSSGLVDELKGIAEKYNESQITIKVKSTFVDDIVGDYEAPKQDVADAITQEDFEMKV